MVLYAISYSLHIALPLQEVKVAGAGAGTMATPRLRPVQWQRLRQHFAQLLDCASVDIVTCDFAYTVARLAVLYVGYAYKSLAHSPYRHRWHTRRCGIIAPDNSAQQ